MKKRIVDILFSLTLLTLLSPLILLMCVMSVCVQGRPIFFVQTRLGKHKQPIRVHKFRSMDKTGQHISAWGRVMRPLGIDELPQLWTILRGDMSFVGPRPLTQTDIERLGWTSDDYRHRWSMKPGLVGLAQFSPVCDKNVSWALDQQYIAQHTLRLDGKIILWAALVPILGKQRVIKRFNEQ